MSLESDVIPTFLELELAAPLCEALTLAGYERPTSIQAETIPHLLAGRDVLGQAKTGTGKTAAFALPLLSRIDLSNARPQVLVLAPTRELALQVAASFEKYASRMSGFRCLALYGGADFGPQLNQLRRGVHVIVGTPGRVMDHMRRGTLQLDNLKTLVLDEADEMLQMGFAEDVEWILTQTPAERQIALFSATLPARIRRIAQVHLREPAEITIQTHTATVDTIRQRFLISPRFQKVDDLDRILEAEPTDGVIIFVKTKSMTVELADELVRRGHAACALNGDMAQGLRERTVEQLRSGRLDILVATDVAARGLDVQRISHVVNYDSPSNSEIYIHRIGRTGRAGRSGESILFIDPRGRGLLRSIERTTGQPIQPMELPTADAINALRVAKFRERVTAAATGQELELYRKLISDFATESGMSMDLIAAALVGMVQGEKPLFVDDRSRESARPRRFREGEDDRGRGDDSRNQGRGRGQRRDANMERFRLEVGSSHGVQPKHIVGAIANEAGLDSANIGQIRIYDNYSTVDLPEGMPPRLFKHLQRVWVAGHQLQISRFNRSGGHGDGGNGEGGEGGPRNVGRDLGGPGGPGRSDMGKGGPSRRDPASAPDAGGGHTPRPKFKSKPTAKKAKGGDAPTSKAQKRRDEKRAKRKHERSMA